MCHRSAIFLLLFLGASLLYGGQLPDGSATVDLLDDRTIIKPGDNLSIRVLEERRGREESKVAENGTIKTRYLGALKAEGMTCRKLAKSIRQKLVALPPHTLPFTYSDVPTVVVAIENIRVYGPANLANLKTVPNQHPTKQPLGATLLTSMEVLDTSRPIEIGDELSLRILEDSHPAMGLKVLAAGEIEAPYLGKIKAAGLTASQLAYQLKFGLQERFFFRPPFFRQPLFRKATVIVCIDSLAHPVHMFRSY